MKEVVQAPLEHHSGPPPAGLGAHVPPAQPRLKCVARVAASLLGWDTRGSGPYLPPLLWPPPQRFVVAVR